MTCMGLLRDPLQNLKAGPETGERLVSLQAAGALGLCAQVSDCSVAQQEKILHFHFAHVFFGSA